MDIQNKHIHTNKDKSREHEPLDNNNSNRSVELKMYAIGIKKVTCYYIFHNMFRVYVIIVGMATFCCSSQTT
jgi:hypothetical protein